MRIVKRCFPEEGELVVDVGAKAAMVDGSPTLCDRTASSGLRADDMELIQGVSDLLA